MFVNIACCMELWSSVWSYFNVWLLLVALTEDTYAKIIDINMHFAMNQVLYWEYAAYLVFLLRKVSMKILLLVLPVINPERDLKGL